MLTKDILLNVIDAHLADRSAVEVSQAAGLPASTITRLRKTRSAPSIDLAAKLLGALGLELHVRRKDEVVDKEALRGAVLAAFDLCFEKDAMRDYSEDEEMMDFAAETYRFFALQGDVVETAHPDSEARRAERSRRYVAALAPFILKSRTAQH